MITFTLVIFLKWSGAGGAVTIPNYPTPGACDYALKVAKQMQFFQDGACIPAPPNPLVTK